MAMSLNPWAVTNFQVFGGPYDEEYMTYWTNGGYGGYNPTMLWQNGYHRGWTERAWHDYLNGRGRRHHRRGPSIRFAPEIHNWGNGWINNGQIQGLNPWAPVFGGPRRLEGADVMGLFGMGGMGAPMMQCMGW